jgi:uncharacterized membrane protein
MNKPDEAAASRTQKLTSLVERELQHPRPYDEVLEDLSEITTGDPAMLRFLRAKDDHHRHAFYVKSEEVWYRRFSWRIMRPLFLVAAIAAIAYIFQRIIDPALGLASFILGAVCVYLAIQYFAHRWMRQNQERLREVDRRYASELENLLSDLQKNQ